MKISCIQMNMKFRSTEENYRRAEKLITDALRGEPDVIVLPEMWNTGFFPSSGLEDLADRNGEQTKAVIGELAGRYGVNIVAGSVADVRDGKIYNTAYVFSRSGECVASYDKTHLFSPSGENRYFEKGSHVCRFTLDSFNCGIIICYDIRFPGLTARLAADGIDLLFVAAQWPKERTGQLEILSRARAIENQMYVVCCNSVGEAGKTRYGGHSAILNPVGEALCGAGESEEIIVADCDTEFLKRVREGMNISADRRPELYGWG